jgi:hypothetical protein
MAIRTTRLAWFAVLLPILTGCGGPTPQERYATALSIYDAERAELKRLEPLYTEARNMASDTVQREMLGYTGQDLVDEARAELDASKDQSRAPTPSKRKDTVGRLKASNEFVIKMITPGTKEQLRHQAVVETLRGYQLHTQQLERVNRAKKSLDEAEAGLPR